MHERLVKSKAANIVTILFLSAVPLAACFIFCIRNNHALSDIYLANSRWNDEGGYYRMIASIAKYNKVLGYCGYNESHANFGGFGAWSPFLILFHVIYAKIFGWSISSPIYCNITLMVIAMGTFAYLVKPTRKQIAFIFMLWCSNTLVVRYILSGMMETVIYAMLIIFLGISIKAYNIRDQYKVSYVIGMNTIVVLLSLMRPYFLLLVFVPAYYCYSKYKRNIVIFSYAVCSFANVMLYFYIIKNCCAQYFVDIINVQWIKLLFSQPLPGIKNMIYILLSSAWKLLQNCGEGIINGSPEGGVYVLYMAALIYLLYICTITVQKETKLCMGYWMFCFCAMLLAIFYLYDIRTGSRHAIAFVLIFAMFFIIIEKSVKNNILLIVGFLWIFCVRAADDYTYTLPWYTDEKAIALLEGNKELIEAGIVDEDADSPWDNTVVRAADSGDFTYGYAFPDGIVINSCYNQYLLDNFKQLKAKYLLADIGGEVDLLCESEGKELISEYANVHVWQLRE